QAVNIGIGTFAVVPTHAAAGENGHLDVEKPIFQMNQNIEALYKLKPSKIKIPPEILDHPLDFQEIAKIIYFRAPIVEQCIHETLLFFADALRRQKELDFFFEGLGILSLRGNKVTVNFCDDCALQLDATGNMLPALLGDPKMLNMIAFRGKNVFTRRSKDGCIVLPRFELQAGQETTSLKPQREAVPGAVSRRVSVYDPVLLAKRRSSVTVKAEKKHKEEEERKQRMRFRHLQRLMEEMAVKQPKPPDEPRPSASASALQRSREAVHLARAQQERRLQVLMASTRKEVEAEIQSQYLECTRRLSAERSQNPFHRLLERDPRPSYIQRREYDEKLVERLMNEQGRCETRAGQTAAEGWQNKPQLLGTAQQ
ncbi:CCD81 protein, partial [Odontophorus gujanensis]|nr:CCD81 protein [Odontophorus gujanensis]